MVRKSVADHRDWDEHLQDLLFACHEAPCSSTGFSPFELRFRREVHGPLDILRQQWVPAKTTSTTVTEWLLKLRTDLTEMRALAINHQENTQARTKAWFDRSATATSFHKGDQVLVFTPAFSGHRSQKLEDRWCGPYTILGSLSLVTYSVDMPERHKRTRLVHVTGLKLWIPPVSNILYISTDPPVITELPDYCPPTSAEPPQIGPTLTPVQRQDIIHLWKDYPTVTAITLGRARSATHRNYTAMALPIHLCPYRIPKAWEEPFRQEITTLRQKHLIDPSRAPWETPMFVVPKKSPGSVRLVVHYRRLNTVNTPDPYCMPRIEDILEKMVSATYFSTFDLARGFYQVPVEPCNMDKTTFLTHFGKFRLTVMPFELRNAPATFQCLMDGLLWDLFSFVTLYIDDISVFSPSWMDYLAHLRQVFDCLRDEGLTIQSGKSQIGMTNCQFLGHTVGHSTITPQEAKLVAIRNYPQPSRKTRVRSFLRMTDYYHHFIPHFSSVAAPLTDLTKKAGPDPVEWSTDCTQAFRRLKELLCTCPVLLAPDYAKTFILQTDASQRGIGAVLSQEDDTGNNHPVAFYSRKMLSWEQNYSATEQEGLAVVDACKHFLPYLLGRPFIIQTDHRPF